MSPFQNLENFSQEPRPITMATDATLRDYFAAKALAAMLANPNKDGTNCGQGGLYTFPEYAYQWADAMLKARKS